MKYLLYFFSSLFLFSLDLGVFSHFKIYNITPNLVLLAVVILAMDKNSYDYFFIALFGGLFLDFYNSSLPGTFFLSLLLSGAILNIIARNILVLEINWKYSILLLILGDLIFVLFLWIFSVINERVGFFGLNFSLVKTVVWWQLFYNLVLFYPCYIFFNISRRYLENFSRRRHSKLV